MLDIKINTQKSIYILKDDKGGTNEKILKFMWKSEVPRIRDLRKRRGRVKSETGLQV